MLDKLPIELLSEELTRFMTKQDEYSLMLTCKTTHYATRDHFTKHYKPPPTLICFDNPIHHDFRYQHLYRTWSYRKDQRCGTRNYYEVKGKYRTMEDVDLLQEEYTQIAAKL